MTDQQRDERFGAWNTQPGAAHEAAPPTMPGAVAAAPSTWPTVFGVISIVLGALGVLGAAFGFVSLALIPRLLPAGQGTHFPGTVMTVSVSSAALNLMVAALLIAAGAGLARRRRWGVGATRTWAIMRIVLAIVGVGVAWWMQSWMRQHPPQTANAPPPGFTKTVQSISLLLGLMWALAWPIICLAWLGRPRVRAEYDRWS